MALHPFGYPLMPAPTLLLASTAGVLVAVDVPFPVEISALAMVGLFLRWLMQRDSATAKDIEERLVSLEDEAGEQRHLKHLVLNRLTALQGTIRLVHQQSHLCTCGAMVPVLPILDQIIEQGTEDFG